LTLAVACSGSGPVAPLTDADLNDMIQIAIEHQEVSKLIEQNEEYVAEMNWYVIAWEESKAVGWYRTDYENIAGGTPRDGISYVTDDVSINPELTFLVGKPTRLFISVFFDLNKKKVLDVQAFPAESGPIPE